jgi:hypothetical protein
LALADDLAIARPERVIGRSILGAQPPIAAIVGSVLLDGLHAIERTGLGAIEFACLNDLAAVSQQIEDELAVLGFFQPKPGRHGKYPRMNAKTRLACAL